MLDNLKIELTEEGKLQSETFKMEVGFVSLGDAVELTLGGNGCCSEGNNTHRQSS